MHLSNVPIGKKLILAFAVGGLHQTRKHSLLPEWHGGFL